MAGQTIQMNQITHGAVLAVVLLLAFADPALAKWWIVRASDKKCLVVDVEPTGKDKSVTKIGKDVYQTQGEAEADVKRVCKEGETEDRSY